MCLCSCSLAHLLPCSLALFVSLGLSCSCSRSCSSSCYLSLSLSLSTNFIFKLWDRGAFDFYGPINPAPLCSVQSSAKVSLHISLCIYSDSHTLVIIVYAESLPNKSLSGCTIVLIWSRQQRVNQPISFWQTFSKAVLWMKKHWF